MKKRILLIAVAALLAVFTVGCSFSVSTAKIQDAIMTNSIDADGKPGEEVTSFPADATVIYTSAKLMNAPDNTQIRIEWTYVTGNQPIDSITLDSGDIASRYIYSNLEPTQALPEGEYQVQYFIDDREEADATVKFSVVAPHLDDVHMTSAVDNNGMPVDSITDVSPSGTWYVSAILSNATMNTKIHFVWYDTDGNVIDNVSFDPQGATDVYIFGTFALRGIVPTGQYRVELYIDNATAPAATVDFNVSNIVVDSGAPATDLAIYKQTEGGFAVNYPKDWEIIALKENNRAWFYPAKYTIEGQDEVNAVIVISAKGSAADYTTESALQAWVGDTVDEKHENYTPLSQSIDTVNGHDVASFVYGWTRDGYTLYTIDYLVMDGEDLYVITATLTNDVVGEMFPQVQQMLLSLQIL